MASVSFVAGCCLGNQSFLINTDLPDNRSLLEEKVISVICLIVSVASSLGTLVLLWPCGTAHPSAASYRQGNIVQSNGVNNTAKCLISAGMLANFGLIVRCSVWLHHFYPGPKDGNYNDKKHMFCVASTIWVQYFFMSVIFWHLVYGLETFMASLHTYSSLCVKHFLGWVLPAALTAIGAGLAYYPDLQRCGAKKEINRAIICLIFLLPIIVILVLISILFYKSLNNVRRSLIRHFGRFSTMERETVDNISVKLLIISTAFIVCWIPNLLNGIFINVLDGRSEDVVLVFLVLEAVLNPFQVLIDSMVMFGWPPTGCCGILRSGHSYNKNINARGRRSRSPSEGDHLLSFSNGHRPRK